MDDECLQVLKEIAWYTKGIWFWMKLFGIITIIGLVVGIIAAIASAH